MHTVKALGPIVGGVQTNGHESPYVSIQINGLTTHYSEETMPVGARTQARRGVSLTLFP